MAITGLLLLRRRWPKELLGQAISAGRGSVSDRTRLVAAAALTAGWGLLAVKALTANFWAYTATLVLFYVLVGLSIVVAGGWTGQLSLGQGALVGVGVFTMLSLRNDHGLDFFPALAITLAAGVGAGLLFGLLSLRLSPTQVAIATLALSLVAAEWLFSKGLNASEFMPVPDFLASDRKLLAGTVVAVAAVVLLLWRLSRSQWGLAYLATRDAPDMAAHFGVRVRTARLTAFALSGLIAALAGVAYGLLVSVVPPFAVGVPMSINVLVFTVVGGMQSLDRPLHRAAALRRSAPGAQIAADHRHRPAPAAGRGHGRTRSARPARGAVQPAARVAPAQPAQDGRSRCRFADHDGGAGPAAESGPVLAGVPGLAVDKGGT